MRHIPSFRELPHPREPDTGSAPEPSPALRGGLGALGCVRLRGWLIPDNAVTRCARSGTVASPKEKRMHRVNRLIGGVVGGVLLLGVGLSWGGPPNNDVTDAQGNTAGGTNALMNNTTGVDNTAFGYGALRF